MTETNKPVFDIRSNRVQGAVFKNKKTSKDGNEYDDFSSNIVKSYKPKGEDEYKETTTFFEDELADLIVVATAIQKYIKTEARKKE